MAHPIEDIEKILDEEITVYSRLYELEEQKGAAILEKDGELLESISIEQEALIGRVSALEARRVRQVNACAGMNGFRDLQGEATLRDFAHLMDEDSSRRLLSRGMELKKLLLKLDQLHTTNGRLIDDNLQFFNMLISGLKNTLSVNTGYSERGMEKSRVSGSVLINKTA